MSTRLPTLEKTWQHDVNRVVMPSPVETGFDLGHEIFISIKDALKGFASNPWTVRGSSNSVAAGMDGVDRLVTRANIIGGTNGSVVHSWIVLRQPGNGLELLFNFTAAGTPSLAVVTMSVGGLFTGGTTNTAPTATDGVQVSASHWAQMPSGVLSARSHVHVMHSTDGKNTKVFVTCRRKLVSLWLVGRASEAVTGWTSPFYAYVLGASGNTTYSRFWGVDNIIGRGPSGLMGMRATLINIYHEVPFYADYFENLVTGEWWGLRVGLYSGTVGMRGRHGYIPDFFLGPEGVPSPTMFPEDRSKQFAKLFCWIVPWDGATHPDVT